MRLIDVDTFVQNVVKYSHQSTKTIGQALHKTPTVDAIPVEWLKMLGENESSYTRYGIEYAIEMWRKGNG